MTNESETSAAYQRWLRGAHRPAHARRTAERNAAFFLPHLRPDMRLLDAGCGPGSITIGLAQAVASSGEVVGIDADPTAVEAARTLAAERGCANARFEHASIYDLPFEDASFDAAFSHAVMQHLQDPPRALRELRRVLKPGAVIGIADADHDGTIMWPGDPLLGESFRLMRELRMRGGGGDPRVGKRLRALLLEAGFVRTEGIIAADCDGTDETTQRAGAFWAAYLRSPELRAHASSLGLATEHEIEAMAAAWDRWAAAPGAFWARFWCQAVGRAE